MRIAYIALGANLSNPKENFLGAIKQLESAGQVVIATSSLWHSPAWPVGLGHPDYTNAVIKVQASLAASDLLDLLHEIEARYGRERKTINAPRPLDLDIIDFGGQICESHPVLPHPRMQMRPFVLLPLLEIAPEWTHPTTSDSVLEALAKLEAADVLSHHVIDRNWLKSPACL